MLVIVIDDPDRELDEQELAGVLAHRLGIAVTDLELRARGRDFLVFVVGDLVIRAPRRPRVLGKLAAERELLDALAPQFGELVPRRADDFATPSPLFAYRWVAGTPIGSAPPTAELVADLARFLAQLHAIDNAPGIRDRDADTVVQRLQAVVRARYLDRYAGAERAAMLELVTRPVPAGTVERCLVHGDLSADNVLVDRERRLAGVIDWSDSAITDPAIDFAAIAYWAGPAVLDELLQQTGRAADRALRERACIIAGLLAALDR